MRSEPAQVGAAKLDQMGGSAKSRQSDALLAGGDDDIVGDGGRRWEDLRRARLGAAVSADGRNDADRTAAEDERVAGARRAASPAPCRKSMRPWTPRDRTAAMRGSVMPMVMWACWPSVISAWPRVPARTSNEAVRAEAGVDARSSANARIRSARRCRHVHSISQSPPDLRARAPIADCELRARPVSPRPDVNRAGEWLVREARSDRNAHAQVPPEIGCDLGDRRRFIDQLAGPPGAIADGCLRPTVASPDGRISASVRRGAAGDCRR